MEFLAVLDTEVIAGARTVLIAQFKNIHVLAIDFDRIDMGMATEGGSEAGRAEDPVFAVQDCPAIPPSLSIVI